jgi:hypothetical protein
MLCYIEYLEKRLVSRKMTWVRVIPQKGAFLQEGEMAIFNELKNIFSSIAKC